MHSGWRHHRQQSLQCGLPSRSMNHGSRSISVNQQLERNEVVKVAAVERVAVVSPIAIRSITSMNFALRQIAAAAFGFAAVLPSVHAEILVGRVVAITDGDTVKILDAGKTQHTIRLAGIDAPEKKMPFGQKAKDALSDLVFNKEVEVETEKLDRYGRTVGKIILNGRDANLAMITAGLAWHYKKYASEQTPADRLLYANAEEEARRKRVGVWSDKDPVAPWDWRSSQRQKSTGSTLAGAPS